MERSDCHIIAIERIYDDRPTETGFARLNTAWYKTEKELSRYERKLLFGVVVEAPIAYSEKNYMPIDPGIPNPKIFIGHDAIQFQRNLGRTDWGNEKYHPGLKERIEFMTISDYGAMIDVKPGERVYFHPSVTEPENFIEEKDGKQFYLAAVDQLICVVEDTIRPQGGYVLVEPHMEDESVRQSETGFILKLETEAKPLEGTVAFARPEALVKPGDFILHQVDANWEVEIEGKKYYAMREDEIWLRKLKTAI